MKKIRFLAVVLAIATLAMMLSGCDVISDLWHEHDYEYSAVDDITHYGECSCGKKTESEEHKFKWIVDKAATESETGLTHRECVVCKLSSHENTVTSKIESESVIVDWRINGDSSLGNPIFGYKISSDFAKHPYEEEFEIHFKIVPHLENLYIKDGFFSIKLEESPYFEIVGESEFSVPDYTFSEVIHSPLEFTFRVKPTYPCDMTETFNFKIKCDYNREALEKEVLKYNYPGFNFDDEYFYTISSLSFLNDSEGMIIGSENSLMFYDSINREFTNGVIASKAECMNRVFAFVSNDMPFVRIYENNTAVYHSKNIKARLNLNQEYNCLYDEIHQGDESQQKNVTKILLGILFDNSIISKEEYEREIQYIENRGVRTKSVSIEYKYIVFDDFRWSDIPELIYIQDDLDTTSYCSQGYLRGRL